MHRVLPFGIELHDLDACWRVDVHVLHESGHKHELRRRPAPGARPELRHRGQHPAGRAHGRDRGPQRPRHGAAGRRARLDGRGGRRRPRRLRAGRVHRGLLQPHRRGRLLQGLGHRLGLRLRERGRLQPGEPGRPEGRGAPRRQGRGRGRGPGLRGPAAGPRPQRDAQRGGRGLHHQRGGGAQGGHRDADGEGAGGHAPGQLPRRHRGEHHGRGRNVVGPLRDDVHRPLHGGDPRRQGARRSVPGDVPALQHHIHGDAGLRSGLLPRLGAQQPRDLADPAPHAAEPLRRGDPRAGGRHVLLLPALARLPHDHLRAHGELLRHRGTGPGLPGALRRHLRVFHLHELPAGGEPGPGRGPGHDPGGAPGPGPGLPLRGRALRDQHHRADPRLPPGGLLRPGAARLRLPRLHRLAGHAGVLRRRREQRQPHRPPLHGQRGRAPPGQLLRGHRHPDVPQRQVRGGPERLLRDDGAPGRAAGREVHVPGQGLSALGGPRALRVHAGGPAGRHHLRDALPGAHAHLLHQDGEAPGDLLQGQREGHAAGREVLPGDAHRAPEDPRGLLGHRVLQARVCPHVPDLRSTTGDWPALWLQGPDDAGEWRELRMLLAQHVPYQHRPGLGRGAEVHPFRHA
mmetsp:Transcript_75012/g.219744  ORF Transcript_75012/g.219744 Transcript_75012/m.219744 type:complete len:628 (+) Transcript_75012:603-2486(+)